ncbi:MAG: protein kinase [Kofleriaceae bacterium]
MIGEVLGNYQILDQISVGGMGTVYRGEHQLIGRIAAIKVLHTELSGNRDIVNRFFNEAKATSSIKHPGIVEVFDFGYMASGHAFLVMEYLDGVTLSVRIKSRGPMPEGEAALYLRGMCGALAAAHARGIVHRDLKPDNVFLVPDLDSPLGERVKLLDFGIAKLTEMGLASSNTKTGAVMGTPTYMSPEQCKGTGDVDHRADLYAIGCMFYELVSGRPPFVQFGAGELIGSHLFLQPDPISQHAQVTPQTAALIMALLEKRPEHRVQSARELADRLAEIAATRYSTAMQTPWNLTNAQAMTAPMPTPMLTPSDTVLSPLILPTPTPIFDAPTTMMPPILVAEKPTTLSGAASVVMLAPPPPVRSRKGIVIGLGLLGGAIAGIVTFLSIRGGGGSDGEGTRASAPPAITAPAPEAPPKPEPPKPEPVVVKPEPEPVVVEPPKPEPPVIEPVQKKLPPVKNKPRPKPTEDPLLEKDL